MAAVTTRIVASYEGNNRYGVIDEKVSHAINGAKKPLTVEVEEENRTEKEKKGRREEEGEESQSF